jgi:hypothetical protein
VDVNKRRVLRNSQLRGLSTLTITSKRQEWFCFTFD